MQYDYYKITIYLSVQFVTTMWLTDCLALMTRSVTLSSRETDGRSFIALLKPFAHCDYILHQVLGIWEESAFTVNTNGIF